MTMRRLPLYKDNFVTAISVYAPTMTNPDENKEAFYSQLASKIIGDFNAMIGRDHDKWALVRGSLGSGNATQTASTY